MSYSEIIDRLEKAEGADRELDARVALLAGDFKLREHDSRWAVFDAPFDPGKWAAASGCKSDQEAIETLATFLSLKPYSASLDATVALVERMLPGCYRASGKTAAYPGMIPGSPAEKFFASVGDWGEPTRSYHDVEPIALLLALFRALSAQEGE